MYKPISLPKSNRHSHQQFHQKRQCRYNNYMCNSDNRNQNFAKSTIIHAENARNVNDCYKYISKSGLFSRYCHVKVQRGDTTNGPIEGGVTYFAYPEYTAADNRNNGQYCGNANDAVFSSTSYAYKCNVEFQFGVGYQREQCRNECEIKESTPFIFAPNAVSTPMSPNGETETVLVPYDSSTGIMSDLERCNSGQFSRSSPSERYRGGDDNTISDFLRYEESEIQKDEEDHYTDLVEHVRIAATDAINNLYKKKRSAIHQTKKELRKYLKNEDNVYSSELNSCSSKETLERTDSGTDKLDKEEIANSLYRKYRSSYYDAYYKYYFGFGSPVTYNYPPFPKWAPNGELIHAEAGFVGQTLTGDGIYKRPSEKIKVCRSTQTLQSTEFMYEPHNLVDNQNQEKFTDISNEKPIDNSPIYEWDKRDMFDEEIYPNKN